MTAREIIEAEDPKDIFRRVIAPIPTSDRIRRGHILPFHNPHRWVYGRIAVVRAENGGYTLALDIHGGTENLPGFYRDKQMAIQRTLRWAPVVLCIVRGENSGDISRAWRAEHKEGIFYSPGWLRLYGEPA